MLDDYLVLLRKYAGKTQIDAAKEAGLDLAKYTSFEKGKRTPNPDECVLLSQMLGFDEDVLSPDAKNSFAHQSNLFKNYGIEYSSEELPDESELIREGLSTEEILLLTLFRKASDENKEKLLQTAKEFTE